MSTDSAADLQKLRARLDSAGQALQALQSAALYQVDDPPPYAPTSARFVQQRQGAIDVHQALEQRWTALALSLTARGGAGAHLPGKLAAFVRGKIQVSALVELVEALERQVKQARQILDELERVPLKVAARCRELRPAADRVTRLVGELRLAGLHGATFDATENAAAQLVADLVALPAWFFGHDEALIRRVAKDVTIQAWQVVEQVDGPLHRHQERLDRWWKALAELAELLTQADELLDSTEQSMDEAAAWPKYPIAWEHYRVSWEQLHDARVALGAAHQPRTVESLLDERDQARQLRAGLDTLSGNVSLVCEQRITFLRYMERLEQVGLGWLQEAKDLHQQAVDYADENWTPGLAIPTKGTVHRKASDAREWSRSCRLALRELHTALVEEIGREKTELRDEIDEMLRVGCFDREQAMTEARHVLQPPTAPLGISFGPPPLPRLDTIPGLMAETHRLLAERPPLLEARQRFNKDIVKPLERPRQTLNKARDAAVSLFESFTALKTQYQGAWPPLDVDLHRAQVWMEAAAAAERRLPRAGRAVPDVCGLWDDMIRSYQQASAEMRAAESRIKREYRELKGMADQLDRWRGQLAACQQAHGHDGPLAQAIGSRLAQLDQACDALRRQWAGHPPPFGQVKKELQGVWMSVHQDIRVPGRQEILPIRDVEVTSR